MRHTMDGVRAARRATDVGVAADKSAFNCSSVLDSPRLARVEFLSFFLALPSFFFIFSSVVLSFDPVRLPGCLVFC